MPLRLPLALAVSVLVLCSCAQALPVNRGEIDLTQRNWDRGPVVLAGQWAFDEGFRDVPDAWTGNAAGGPDGRGAGTYRLRVLAGNGPQLALRYGPESTAFSVSANGIELVRVGNPDRDPQRAVSAYAPGTVALPPAAEIDLEIFVTNHDYRVGGLWAAPQIGPVSVLEHAQWADEASQLALATGLAVIGVSSLLLFSFRRSAATFAFLGLFSLLIALRCLVTGEYTMVKILPGIPFDVLIRLEYWTAFLPLPAGCAFFFKFYPKLMPRVAQWILVVPSLAFAVLPAVLPLDLLTRSITFYFPLSIPSLLYAAVVLTRRVLRERKNLLLLVGIILLIGAGLVDSLVAALATSLGTLVPWGLGAFVVLQAISLAQTFLKSFETTEALLAEKEFLIREIHHRVKNSLQVVASLVTLQSRRITNEEQRQVFQALRRRVIAVALVQEKLYAQTMGIADLGEYLRELLHLQYDGDLIEDSIDWTLEGGPLAADADYCVDVGLILTELVANAQKHAVLSQGGGVSISVVIAAQVSLEVDDDGPGFPAGFAPTESHGLGLQVVVALLSRHDGSIAFLPGPGGRVRVELKLPSASD